MLWRFLYRMAKRENARLRERNAYLEDRVKVLRAILHRDPRLTIVRPR